MTVSCFFRPAFLAVILAIGFASRPASAQSPPSDELRQAQAEVERLKQEVAELRQQYDARLTALMPGRVVKVMAAAGDRVAKGQALMILDAMKMEHTITSPREGVIERVAYKENELVPADAVLVVFRENKVPSP